MYRKHWWKKSDINWIISYVHGLEDFILLKCKKYSKPSADSEKFLSQSQ